MTDAALLLRSEGNFMNDIPKITIIVPMYNVEEYVGECLDSILVQTFKDYD